MGERKLQETYATSQVLVSTRTAGAVFETAVLRWQGGNGPWPDVAPRCESNYGKTWREYDNEAEAMAGHTMMCELWAMGPGEVEFWPFAETAMLHRGPRKG